MAKIDIAFWNAFGLDVLIVGTAPQPEFDN